MNASHEGHSAKNSVSRQESRQLQAAEQAVSSRSVMLFNGDSRNIRERGSNPSDEVSMNEDDYEDKGKDYTEPNLEIAGKRKHSISYQAQNDYMRQRIYKARAMRENRRRNLDAHHHYLFEFVAKHWDLKVKDVEEFMLDFEEQLQLLESFCERRGSKSLLFTYQMENPPGIDCGRFPVVTKKEKTLRVLLSNGTTKPLKGEIIYFIRPRPTERLTGKNIADEVFFGYIPIDNIEVPGFLLESLKTRLKDVYMAHLIASTSWVAVADQTLRTKIRHQFVASVEHYLEFLQDSLDDIRCRLDLSKTPDMDEVYENHLRTSEAALEASMNPMVVVKVENVVNTWCRYIEKELALSKQIRKESDSMGPLAELAYWRNLMAKMSFIVQQVQDWKLIAFIQVLVHSKSKVLRRWKDVDTRVTNEYQEAKDNVRYMYALEKFCQPLYQSEPPAMIPYVEGMMYTIQTVHSTSRYFNSCEKVTALMVKIANQMISSCKKYLTNDERETVWNQPRAVMTKKLHNCIALFEAYHNAYEKTREYARSTSENRAFEFSTSHIFGPFKAFCARLRKITELVEIFDMYSNVHLSRIDGIEVISQRLVNLQRSINKRTTDPLDFRNPDFDAEFTSIKSAIDDIQASLEAFMDRKIEGCPTALHGLQLLKRFENLRNHCLDISGKQVYLFEFYNNEINVLRNVYENEKNDTPIARGLPPFAGKLMWARHLYKRLERVMIYFEQNTDVVKLESSKPVIKNYNTLAKKLVFYEILFHDAWMKQTNVIYDALEAPMLTIRGNLRQEIVLNFDPFFRQIFEETEIIRKLGMDIPYIAQIVYIRQDRLLQSYEVMKALLDRFLSRKATIPADLQALMRPSIKRVERSLMLGVSTINWASGKLADYFSYVENYLLELEALTAKVQEILKLRINQILYDICHTWMLNIPDAPMEPMVLLEKVRTYGAIVAKDLEYKSRACESAVIEMINLLLTNSGLEVPETLLLSWMNPFALGQQGASVGLSLHLPSPKVSQQQHQHRKTMHALASTLEPSVKDELSALHEEARHVFSYYGEKCIEALQKCTRISVDALRRRTEEPHISKRMQLFRVAQTFTPLFLGHLVLTIPTISLQPPLEEIQMILVRSCQLMVECLKYVIIWGQKRRLSFDMYQEEAYYKIPTMPSPLTTKDKDKLDTDPTETYQRIQTQEEIVRSSLDVGGASHSTKLHSSYKPVMEYKDINKMLLMMQGVVTQARQKVQHNTVKYMSYSFLWRDDKEVEIAAIMEQDPVLTEIQAIWRRYGDLEVEINNISSSHRAGPLEITTKQLKIGLLVEVKEWKMCLCRHISGKYRERTAAISKFIDEANKDLSNPIRDMHEIGFMLMTLDRIRNNFVTHEPMLTPIEEAYTFLASVPGFKVPEEESNRADFLRLNYLKLLARAEEIQERVAAIENATRIKLNESIIRFQGDLQKYGFRYNHHGPMIEGLLPTEASDRLITFQDEFDELYERYSLCKAGEKLFGIPQTQYPLIVSLQKELALLQKLYGLYNDVMKAVNGYGDIKWVNLDITKIVAELTEFQNRCRRLPKALKTWPAYLELKERIDDFNETCPLLELMTNKSMKERHWDTIGRVIHYNFDVAQEGFSLKHVLAAPLLKHKDQIEDICIGATKEKDIEAKVKQIVIDFATIQLTFAGFKNRGDLLLKGQETGDIMTQLEDSLMILNYLYSNRYSSLYRKEIQRHLQDFSNTLQILETWLSVQNLWIYLEAVFVGGDIARQMPLEAKRFQNIDRNWVKIMSRAKEIQLVIPCCVGEDLMGTILPFLLEQLEMCQKSLSGYLENKRKLFPRFFFVSDPGLLEILGQASDSHTIQPHLLSIFENVDDIEFNPKSYNQMMAVISKEGERIPLDEPVTAEGNVELWLGALLTEQRKSLLAIIRDAVYIINTAEFDLLEFLSSFISQVCLLGIQILWTRDAEKALSTVRREKKIMKTTNDKFIQILNQLIDQTTRPLTKFERLKYETLITIHVHQRDIFEDLYKGGVKSVMDFEWLKQARFYFDMDKCFVKVTDIVFEYQNEALGNTDRLVITPLTDRCYITIAQAVGSSLGAAPAGPAGTGKTETAKDMAKTLGKYCVVFNCSDQMDFRGLGRIFKGLAQSGSWGCFDEFNRIELPVLSVAAQQIHLVLSARREHKEAFIFSDGDTVELSKEVGIIITMNPGYAGRQELPENLKVQFRSIAMVVPDRLAIIRVKLAACGFLQNIILARKFYILYRLCDEQLSKQVHYDFGLRNILSVLRTLGFQKRSRPKDAEETVVMSVLRDMNLSKLADEDEGLFLSLIKDLFPGVTLESVTHDQLQAAISEEVTNAKLVNHPPWNLKVIQFYETSLVRHGLMALGPTGSGKTCMLQTLMKALTLMDIPHKEVRMNPKAITASQMFGRLDVGTNDWTDGIFSTLWRKALKIKKTENLWIVLDGPVDAVWIENLNSVLDDNKTLTLANGDRIVMAAKSKLVFEPDNVDNASPATISRMGMVFMSASILPWQPIFQSWLLRRTKVEAAIYQTFFDKIFTDLIHFIRSNTSPKMVVMECMYIRQATDLLDGLLPSKELTNAPGSIQKETAMSSAAQEHVFLFALMWSTGALLELNDREKLQDFFISHHSGFDWPNLIWGETIFEYTLAPNGAWVNWTKSVENFEYPTDYIPEYASILVPNVDNVRTNFLIGLVSKQEKGVLLIGEQGTAKTVMIQKFMSTLKKDHLMHKMINFSSATTPNMFQRTIEGLVDKRMGTQYGPPGGRKMIIFIDDINMPDVNDWGDQVTNEIVRQLIEMRGMYSLDKPGEFNYIVDIQFIAAMIHPGGGRNDIPHRLKRHFCIFNTTLPSDSSLDKIFGTIAEGYFCPTRFDVEMLEIVRKFVPLTRKLWQKVKARMLPTPAKFHYVFNLRDLSRIWEGILKVTKSECANLITFMSLWKHECKRVISDRFVNEEDQDWFNQQIRRTVDEEEGEEWEALVPVDPHWINFMKDPEDLLDSGLPEDMEIPDFPNVYEMVTSFDEVEARLQAFQVQYNEEVRGAHLDMVFFRDAIFHILRITRIIRTDRGSAMLIGVGGSGKQSLTRLSTFLSGYVYFQITLTRSYNTSNLLDDLKVLFKLTGQSGRGVTFMFTDNDIKDEGFLEYINNILCSGEVANLIPREEIDEICNDLIMPMKKEFPKRLPITDSLYDYFIGRVRRNLHVVLCFSPVGPKFRLRSLKFPGLVSGCTLDWFSRWPMNALIAVARHFLANFPIVCPGHAKLQLIELMGHIHDQVSATGLEYFDRFRRQTHVTPKSYLSFLSGYKTVYRERRKYFETLSKRMDVGLKKLEDAGSQIAVLSYDLAVMEKNLAIASAEADAVLSEVTVVAEAAARVKDEMAISKDNAAELVEIISKEKIKAEKQLEKARPALEEAQAALKTINQGDISTVRKLGKPPHLIMRIMDCVLLYFYKRLDPYTIDPEKRCPKPSWGEALKLLGGINFLNLLKDFPLDTINGEMLELMEPITSMEDYNMENARRVCGDIAGLCSWTRALGAYFVVNKAVLPLKMNLVISEAKLVKANKELAHAQSVLVAKEEELSKARTLYEKAMKSRQSLQEDANRVERKMNLASNLINDLAGERERWTDQSKQFKSQIVRLIGDCILLTGFLSYTGPFNSEYRNMLEASWRQEVRRRKIPCSLDLDVMNMLVDPHTVSEWHIHGLPSDELSIQNAIIAKKASRYPLLIDPQIQGKSWLKKMEGRNGLQVTSQNQKYFRNHLENALSQGQPLLIEDCGEEFDPVLDNVLDKNFIRIGTNLKVKLGDTEVDVLPSFSLYMTTKLANPSFSPEIFARTSTIDFTVTMKGLEDQLLARVIQAEKEDLETERLALVEAVATNRKRMQDLEEHLLNKLSSAQGSLLDDESLQDVLNNTKTTAVDVKDKLFIAAEMERKINVAREEFRPIATRGSILYFLICDMAIINCMYQTSLNQFLELFDNSMERSEKTLHTVRRIHYIIDFLTYEVFRYSSRGLFEPHKFLFVLLMALKIDIHKGLISYTEFQVLIKGGAALDLNDVMPNPATWIAESTWLNVVELTNSVPRFANICRSVSRNDKSWKFWFDKDKPEEEAVPDGFEKQLDPFNRLLLIRAWCPDRIIHQAKKYVAKNLGARFTNTVILSFEGMWNETRPTTPLCCFLSMGSDPTIQIEAVAKRNRIHCHAISMGQGQEVHARAIIASSMAEGGWVLLQNCHLGLDFMHELNALIANAANPHFTFRLWLTTEVHPKFSISLLQNSLKFTNDPPQGVKAGLKRTYSSFPPEMLDYTNAPQWRSMLYAISFLHSVVQERRKFGPLGWNIPYEFNWADWAASVQFLQKHLDDVYPRRPVSWVTVRYMIGEVHYGGRVTDDYDKRLLLTYCKLWFNEGMLGDHFQFSDGYVIPPKSNMDETLRFMEELPAVEEPGVFGLHRNAGITYQSNEARSMLDMILSIQPKDSNSGTGETREAVVHRLATQLLEKLPSNYSPFKIQEKIAEMGGVTPMNIFLKQELDRMRKVLNIVQQTLTDVRLAIEGTIILSESLRDALDNMYDARVPAYWRRHSWQSESIGFWFTELLERNQQYSKWISKGRPQLFWMTGFFNAQGFLTAMKQEVTRAHKGWALDQVTLHNEVLKITKEEAGSAGPLEGVYIYGLYLDGAGWDKFKGVIVESMPKVLFCPMPVIHMFVTDSTKPKDCNLYECPLYKKPGRTLLNFVTPIWLRTNISPNQWVIRGVAALCDTK